MITNTAVTHIILPTGLQLTTNHSHPTIFPNPVNKELTIQFNNEQSQKVTIQLYNIYGQKVRDLYSGTIESEHAIKKFDVSDLSQGVYFIQFNSGRGSILVKM
ncbi:MAG: T9SS type A sorting domain-containing protein [Bacteroidetes bacterium]|nr:T9SS type A sorting domain-containing protein [Bacteroidota bacterium]